MAMVRELHRAGYQRLYLYSWPKPSGLHWRWHLFSGPRNWIERPWREGWYGSGAEYNFNPVMGWGDGPSSSPEELARLLAQFDPQGLAQALGQDEEHANWFELVCATLLPDYAFSLGWHHHGSGSGAMPQHLPVMPIRRNVPDYAGPPLPWPPGWRHLWKRAGPMPQLSYDPPVRTIHRITPEPQD